MPVESSVSLRFNLGLVLAGLKRWPLATTVVLILLVAATAFHASEQPHADAIYITVSLFGCVAGALGTKAFLYLMSYAALHKARFPGSYLVATAITMIPIFAFYACAFYLLGVPDGKFPPLMAVLVLFGLGYPLFTLFFAAFFRAQDWMQLKQQEFWRRIRKTN